MRNVCKLILALAALACAAFAQTTYGIEVGPAVYLSSTPHSAGDATFVVSPGASAVASYTTIEIRPINSLTPTVVTRTGAQWTVATSGKLDFSLLGQLGAANGDSTSLAGAMGAKIAFVPGWVSMPGLYFFLMGQGVGTSAALGGWEPQASIGVGYQFSGIQVQASTLSMRRKVAKALGKRP